jgi:hypothetical protein
MELDSEQVVHAAVLRKRFSCPEEMQRVRTRADLGTCPFQLLGPQGPDQPYATQFPCEWGTTVTLVKLNTDSQIPGFDVAMQAGPLTSIPCFLVPVVAVPSYPRFSRSQVCFKEVSSTGVDDEVSASTCLFGFQVSSRKMQGNTTVGHCQAERA